MWMQRSGVLAQGAPQRNFLRENKMLVRSQGPMSTVRRLEREQGRWMLPDVANYKLPTATSVARRAGQPPLIDAQRRLKSNVRHGTRVYQRCSEKQIQTEDITDEQFLNAALLKCIEQGHGHANGRLLVGCSEGDELPITASSSRDCLRRTASNFELGKMNGLRSSCQSVPYTLHRPLGGCDGLLALPTELDVAAANKQPTSIEGEEMKKEEERKEQSPHVQQLAIPNITDVEQHPQLDQPLSARTTASSCFDSNETTPVVASSQALKSEEQRQLEQEQVLLTESQRLSMLQAAQARHRALIWEYNRLPLAMETLRVRNLKIQLERQLDRIDSDLRLLGLPQVYIRRDQLQQISSISC